jgi:hypothetical protein
VDPGSIFSLVKKEEQVYQGTPAGRNIGKDQSVGSSPSWRAWATAWVRLLAFNLP